MIFRLTEPSANHGRDGAPAQVHAGECAQHGLRDNSANRHRGATASWGMPSPAIAPSVCGIVPDVHRSLLDQLSRKWKWSAGHSAGECASAWIMYMWICTCVDVCVCVSARHTYRCIYMHTHIYSFHKYTYRGLFSSILNP